MIRELENLNEATRESALVLARGGHDVAAVLPDLAIRGQFLKEGGAETVAAIGLHGPEAARAALRLDEAIKSGSLVVREGQRAVKLADFGAAMLRTGEGGWRFWQTYVVPHWKLWLAGGALAAYLADPEYFQTKAGDLTERGFQKLIELLGVLSARAIQGAGEGAKKAAEDTGKAAIDSFFTGWNSVTRILGLLILLFVVSLLFRRIRYFVLLPFYWLQSSPAQTKANHDDGQAKP